MKKFFQENFLAEHLPVTVCDRTPSDMLSTFGILLIIAFLILFLGERSSLERLSEAFL